jgi:hypothetical protein
MNDEWKHPELREGEVHIADMTARAFETCCHTTKRLGEVAYEHGQPVPADFYIVRWFPVFVQESELIEKGIRTPN